MLSSQGEPGAKNALYRPIKVVSVQGSYTGTTNKWSYRVTLFNNGPELRAPGKKGGYQLTYHRQLPRSPAPRRSWSNRSHGNSD